MRIGLILGRCMSSRETMARGRLLAMALVRSGCEVHLFTNCGARSAKALKHSRLGVHRVPDASSPEGIAREIRSNDGTAWRGIAVVPLIQKPSSKRHRVFCTAVRYFPAFEQHSARPHAAVRVVLWARVQFHPQEPVVRSRVCRLICVLAVLVIALPLAAQDRDAGLKTAFARARHLQHGINASMWFAQSTGNYSAAHTNRYIDAADIALMARLGFDNVRLSIDPAPLDQYPHGADGFNDEFLGRIDRAVDSMIASGLAVQIDVHPEDGYKQQLRSSDDAVDRFVMLWRRLAAHFAVRNPQMVFFEILNEPEVSDRYRWAGIQQRVAAAIRESAPQNTIIATGAN